MEVNYIRLYSNEAESIWAFLLCSTDKPEDDQIAAIGQYNTAGQALDAAMSWCKDRGVILDWYTPMAVARPMARQNVVEAADRFRPPVSFRSHPSSS